MKIDQKTMHWRAALKDGSYKIFFKDEDSDMPSVATINDCHTEDKKYAQIIAAAPDLLMALKMAHKTIDSLWAERISQDSKFMPSQHPSFIAMKFIWETISKLEETK